jgi:hypothetical protein
MISDDFEHPCPTKPLQRLCAFMLRANLRSLQRIAHGVLNRIGEDTEVLIAGANPRYGLDWVIGHLNIMVEPPYNVKHQSISINQSASINQHQSITCINQSPSAESASVRDVDGMAERITFPLPKGLAG